MAMRLLLAILGLAAATTPVWSSCSGSEEECQAEEGSLLQLKRDASATQQQVAAQKANGCPPDWLWKTLFTVAQKVFTDQIKESLPLRTNHTFDSQVVKIGNCSGALKGLASISVDALVGGSEGLTLDQLSCNSAVCSETSWGVCTEYNPINASVGVSADTLNFASTLNGEVTWEEGCPYINGSGSLSLSNVKSSFTATSPKVTGTGAVDLVVNPPNISSPAVSAANVDYASITDVQCSVDGESFSMCVDAIDLLNTEEYKQKLNEAIALAINKLGGQLESLLKESGLSLS